MRWFHPLDSQIPDIKMLATNLTMMQPLWSQLVGRTWTRTSSVGLRMAECMATASAWTSKIYNVLSRARKSATAREPEIPIIYYLFLLNCGMDFSRLRAVFPTVE